MSSPRLPSTLLALASWAQRRYTLLCEFIFTEFEHLLPAGDEARAQHVVHAEGLGGRGGRRGVRRVGKLLPQLLVQDEPVAVVGNAPSW